LSFLITATRLSAEWILQYHRSRQPKISGPGTVDVRFGEPVEEVTGKAVRVSLSKGEKRGANTMQS